MTAATGPRDGTGNTRGATSLRDQVYERLRSMIVRGEFAAGELLLEAELAERFQVSKTPVREALVLLERDRLVTIVPRRGYFVVTLSVKAILEILEMRRIVECAAVRMAGTAITEAELTELEEIVALGAADLSTPEFVDRNARFHGLIASASRNGRLAAIVTDLAEQMHLVLHQGQAPAEGSEQIHQDHVELVRALRAGDPERAAVLMDEHIQRSGRLYTGQSPR